MLIKRDDHTSMYEQLANILQEQIESSKFNANQKLPSELELAKMYQVSRITVRLALTQLQEKGFVVRKQGKGTFVSDSFLRQELGYMKGFYDTFLEKDLDAKLLEMKVIVTPDEILEKLDNRFTETLFLNRLYTRKGLTYGIAHVYLPIDLTNVVTWDLAEKNSAYSLLSDYGGYKLKNADLSIRAFPNTKELSEVLQVDIQVPLLKLFRTTFDENDKPIEHLILILRADMSEFNMTVPNNFPVLHNIRDTQQ